MGVPIVLVHYEKEDFAQSSRYVTTRVRAPHPEHSPNDFLDCLFHLASRFKGGVLVPASDEALEVIARNKAQLQNEYLVAAPEPGAMERIVDKQQADVLAEEAGVAVPRTFSVSSRTDVEELLGSVQFPCLLKPTHSHLYFRRFRRKLDIAQTPEELLAVYDSIAPAGLGVIVQEFIPGEDTASINYNSYSVQGKVYADFTARKIRMAPPFFGTPGVVRSDDGIAVREIAGRLLSILSYDGYSCIEFKWDYRDSQFKLLDVNGRFNVSSSLSVRCGVNFAWLMYRHLTMSELPPKLVNSFSSGVYWIDGTKDIAFGLSRLKDRSITLREFLRPYRSPHIFAVADAADYRPFVSRSARLVGNGARRATLRALGRSA